MTLINIGYGSLASSDTMNKNFSYLEDKIDEVSDSTTTLLSSVMSNIATINSRLSELAADIQESAADSQADLVEAKSKTKILFNKISMLPDWSLYFELTGDEKSSYTASLNGYLLINPSQSAESSLKINGTNVPLKPILPVKSGDKMIFTQITGSMYFLPTVGVTASEL